MKIKKSKKKKLYRLIIIIAASFLAAVVVAGAGILWWYNNALLPRSIDSARIRVVIAPGSAPDVIAAKLEQSGVIKSALAFGWLARQQGSRDGLQAGEYIFSSNQPAKEILDWLVRGKVDTYNVTIYPGKTLADIKKQLIKSGYAADAIDKAFAKTYNHPLFADKPASASLEGYILPETYQVSSSVSVEQLLIRTFDEFSQLIDSKGLRPALAARGFNLYQGITLASIVQQEVANQPDRRQVAQVFEKRLKEDISLGADATFVYASKLTGQPASPSLDSPYNTRKYKGLPPGPIASVTMSALDAVANPASGDYLFFVSGDDGVTHFARTQEEHEANTKRYCVQLCGLN
jgi:UPF0755 protein